MAAPEITSPHLFTVPSGSSFEPLHFSGDWIQVSYRNESGWIRLSDTISRVNFAAQIQLSSGFAAGTWHTVQSVDSDGIRVSDRSKKIAPSEIISFRSDPTKCFTRFREVTVRSLPAGGAPEIRRLAPLAPVVDVLEMNMRWGLAEISRHGEVWWPIEMRTRLSVEKDEGKALPFNQIEFNNQGLVLTGREFFKRKVTQVVTSPLHKNFIVASAGGVFKTWDGKIWTEVFEFRDRDYPILFSKKGELFIGPFISHDNGETFAPYIRWESVISAISRFTKLHPNRLTLSGLELDKQNEKLLSLTVDVGLNQIVKVTTSDLGENWFASVSVPTPTSSVQKRSLAARHVDPDLSPSSQ